jgi:hypothetical protein
VPESIILFASKVCATVDLNFQEIQGASLGDPRDTPELRALEEKNNGNSHGNKMR